MTAITNRSSSLPGEPALRLACDGRQPAIPEREILAIADYERQRIGQELHDGLCQSLAGIAALTAVLSRTLAANALPGPAAAAAEIVGLLNEAIREARDVAHGLSPIGQNGAGLVDALETLARNVSRTHGTCCTFANEGRCPELRRETIAHLVRIAQEAIRNAITHGGADAIELRLACVHGSGALSITDNGIGLPPHGSDTSGIGVHTMEYRARAIGGRLTMASQPQRGVIVTCAFPLRSADERAEVSENADCYG